jgi:CDP-diglyceride synthetase
MKRKFQTAVSRARNNPVLRRTATQIKPKKTVWGFLGVVLFFIVPEIVAFIWGADITAYAHAQMLQAPSQLMATWYEALIMLFEDGGSWVNLAIGFAFLLWLFF